LDFDLESINTFQTSLFQYKKPAVKSAGFFLLFNSSGISEKD